MRRGPAYQERATVDVFAEVVPAATLERALVDAGMPRADARAVHGSRMLRLFATRFYFDQADAERGDTAARERVDWCRHAWSEMAKHRGDG
jgi:hypothetical protein